MSFNGGALPAGIQPMDCGDIFEEKEMLLVYTMNYILHYQEEGEPDTSRIFIHQPAGMEPARINL